MESDVAFRMSVTIIVAASLAAAGLVGYVLVRDRDTGCDCGSGGEPDLCTHLPPSNASAIIGDGSAGVTVLDVRTEDEYGEGRIPGAENLDYYAPDFWSLLDGRSRNGTYVIYCEDGIRSHDTCSVMVSMGFSDVRDIQGGFIAWKRGGYPVEK